MDLTLELPAEVSEVSDFTSEMGVEDPRCEACGRPTFQTLCTDCEDPGSSPDPSLGEDWSPEGDAFLAAFDELSSW